MATAIKAATALHEETISDFVIVRADEIDAGDRLREIDPVWAEALGRVMMREGQRTPIEICQLPGRTRWTLVAGGHRHAGALNVGIEFLRAEIVSADRTDRKLREVSENLWRRDLQPIDRAAFIAELVALRRTKAGIAEVEKREGKVNLGLKKLVEAEADVMLETISSIYGFTEEVGAGLGFSGRTIRNDLLLYRGIAPSLVARLREARHPALANATQLRALAKLYPNAQTKVVDLLVSPGASLNYGQPKTIADAIKHPLGPKPAARKPTAEDARFNTVTGTLKRMSSSELNDLFASQDFHNLIPAKARRLLAPMLESFASTEVQV